VTTRKKIQSGCGCSAGIPLILRKKVRPVVLGRGYLYLNYGESACLFDSAGARAEFVILKGGSVVDKCGTLQFVPDPPKPKRGKR